MNSREKICLQCGTTYKVYDGYAEWCEFCDWNLNSNDESEQLDMYEKIVRKIGDKYSKKLFAALMETDIEKYKHRNTLVATTTVVMALLVVLVWLSLVVSSVLLLLLFPNIFAILGSVMCLLLVIYLRPKFSKKPKDVITKQEMPVLWEFVESLNEKLGGKPIDYLVVNADFNASMGYVGIQRKKVLTLGYPLVSLLSKQEFVDLVGHELAHNVNQDPARGFLHYYVFTNVWAWYYFLSPKGIMQGSDVNYIFKIASIPFYVLMWCASKTALGFLFVYYWMIHYDSQKAEYYADYLGACMGGSEDSEKSLYKISYGLFLQYVQQQAVVAPNGKTIIQRLKEMIETIPEKEILRLQKLATRKSSRVDSSHPPTTYRIEFVKKFAPKVGLFQLTQEHFHKICEELAQQEEKINIKLIDEYKWYIS